MKKLIYLFFTSLLFACETTITPELDTPANIIVVDAWINQKMERQEIRIIRSQPYFDNSVPQKISGATVTVEDLDNGTHYEFQESESAYIWNPVDVPLGEVGHHYKLTVKVDGETFVAHSRLGRVPPVDSILFTYYKKDLVTDEAHYKAQFMATDPAGQGDTYWIKAWKNGVFLGKPDELNLAYDAGFTAGQPVDGQVLLLPIRKDLVNPLDKNPEQDNKLIPPYLPGDSLYVEIHSLDPLAFDFLFGAWFQINRGGFAELFSIPLANAITNLESTDKNSTTPIAGFFNVAAVSARGQKLTPEIAEAAKLNAE